MRRPSSCSASRSPRRRMSIALGVVLFELLAGRRPTATSGEAKTYCRGDSADAGDGCAASVRGRFEHAVAAQPARRSRQHRCDGVAQESWRTLPDCRSLRAGLAALPRARACVCAAALAWLSHGEVRAEESRGGGQCVRRDHCADRRGRLLVLADDPGERAATARRGSGVARGVRARLRGVRAHRCGRDRSSVHDVRAAAACGAGDSGLWLAGQPGGDRAGHQARHAVRAARAVPQGAGAVRERAHSSARRKSRRAALAVRLRARSNASLCRTLAAERCLAGCRDRRAATAGAGFARADRMPGAEIGSRVDAAGHRCGARSSASVRRAGGAVVSAGEDASGLATRAARHLESRGRTLRRSRTTCCARRSSCSRSSAGNARPMRCSCTPPGAS